MFLFKKKKIEDRELNIEEVTLDFFIKKKEEEKKQKENKIEVPLEMDKRVDFFVGLFFLFLLLQLVSIQFLKASQYKELFQKQASTILKIESERGIIYDRNLVPLVENKLIFNLVIEKEKFLNSNLKESTLKKLESILAISKEEIERKIEESQSSEVEIYNDLNKKQLILIEAELNNWQGVKIVELYRRHYLQGKYFSHVLGYLSRISREEWEKNKSIYKIDDMIGAEGVEKQYEEILRKKPGVIRVEKNARGQEVETEIISLPQPGQSIVLTIDARFQEKLAQAMEKQLQTLGLKKGAGIVLNPKTGEILAMVSFPLYDNNIFSSRESQEILKVLQDPDAPLFNRALQGQYPIGSVIKPFLALAALQEGIITENTVIDDYPGVISIPHRYQPNIVYEYRDWRIHGLENVKKALAESCNIFFYAIGGGWKDIKGLGPSRIKHYLSLFGFGSETGIDLSGEKKGVVPDPLWKRENIKQDWWDGDTYLLSIGQGYFKATPLQTALAISAIANEGKLMKPFVLKKILNEKNESVFETTPVEKSNISLENKYFKIVKEGMRWAVTGENAPSASATLLSPFPVAAKTGTAEILGKKLYDVWVATFAPYYDPELVLVVMFEDSPTLSLVVVPVARDFFDWYFNNEFKK